MNLKKILAAAMITSMTVASAPIIAPAAVQDVLVSKAEAARGGARIAPRSAPAAPKAAPAQSNSGKSVSGNGNSYAPSKNANELNKTAPNAASAKPGAAANAANAAKSSTGWGSALRNIGLLAGGMLLGSMLASMFGLGSGFLADVLGVLANVAIAFAVIMAIRWAWNRFRGRKEEENVYRSASPTRDISPRPTVTDIRPQGVSAPLPSDIDAGDNARSIADRYRSR